MIAGKRVTSGFINMLSHNLAANSCLLLATSSTLGLWPSQKAYSGKRATPRNFLTYMVL